MDNYEVILVTLSEGEGEEMVLALSLSKGVPSKGEGVMIREKDTT